MQKTRYKMKSKEIIFPSALNETLILLRGLPKLSPLGNRLIVKAYSKKARKIRVYTSQYTNRLRGISIIAKTRNIRNPTMKTGILAKDFALSLFGGTGTANANIQTIKKTNRFTCNTKV
jgi:hypothetical protein